MKNKWSIIVLIVAIIILVVILVVGQTGRKQAGDNGAAIILPEATGDAGDTAEAIIKMAENEADILVAESADLDLMDSELQSLDSLENVYDENEL